MEPTTIKLRQLMVTIKRTVNTFSNAELERKADDGTWSKKEILGHLIDSTLHNLRRFVAAHYMEMPFAITDYEKEALVTANHYQELSTRHLLALFCSLNDHIVEVVSRLTPEQLADEVIYPDEFKFLSVARLYEEYVEHLEEQMQRLLD